MKIKKVVEVCKNIADFIIGEANIPEANESGDYLEQLMKRMVENSMVNAGNLDKATVAPTKSEAAAE